MQPSAVQQGGRSFHATARAGPRRIWPDHRTRGRFGNCRADDIRASHRQHVEQRERLCVSPFGCAFGSSGTRTERAAVRESLILVPIDLSRFGEAKLPVVERYARLLNADVLLLHVLPSGALDPATVLPSEATARTYLDTVGARLRN